MGQRLDAMASRHRPVADHSYRKSTVVCPWCSNPGYGVVTWPCDAARLLMHIARCERVQEPGAETAPTPARQWQAIRPDATGAVDDVAISGDLYRLERMDRGVWWSCIYRGDQRTCFWFRIEKRDIVVTVSEDSIGCVDDRKSP